MKSDDCRPQRVLVRRTGGGVSVAHTHPSSSPNDSLRYLVMRRQLRERATFFEVAMSRSKSMRTSIMAIEYLVEWGRCSDAVGVPVSVEEYADRMEVSRPQAFRRQKAFRECFPRDEIETTWAIVKPFLDKRGYRNRTFLSQAIYVGTLTCLRSGKGSG